MNSLKRQLDDCDTEGVQLNSSKKLIKTTEENAIFGENSLSDLPHEILLHIFRRLNLKEICKMSR